MIKNRGNFMIKFEEQDKEFVENSDWEKLNEGYNKAKRFFEFEKDIFPIKICFIYAPEEWVFFSRYKKHENWNIAFAGNNNIIYIFAPSVLEKYTIHKKDQFFPTLIHEITHFFYRDSIYERDFSIFPLWNEGIAEYITDRENKPKICEPITNLNNCSENSSMNYKAGFLLIDSIMDEFKETGNKKIIQFLKETSSDWTQEKLSCKFEEIFGIDVNKLIELKGGIKK